MNEGESKGKLYCCQQLTFFKKQENHDEKQRNVSHYPVKSDFYSERENKKENNGNQQRMNNHHKISDDLVFSMVFDFLRQKVQSGRGHEIY